jgi:hypothetical protein
MEEESPLLALSNAELRELIQAHHVAIPPESFDHRIELLALAEKHCTASDGSAPTTSQSMSVDAGDYASVKINGVDFTCPVCTELIYKPVTTPCGHTFCEACLGKALAYKPQCPMCRDACTLSCSQFKINVLLAAIIEHSFGEAYKKRGPEMEKQMELLRQAKKKLIIGNTHELVQSASHNRHKWRFFCTVLNLDERLGAAPAIPGSFYIQKVEVFLHPTFQPNRVVLTEQPFEFTRIGWGEFTIKGVVHFQPKFNMPPMVFEHLLSFRGNGTHREYHVVFGGEGQNQP